MVKYKNKWLWLLLLLGMAAYFHFTEQPTPPNLPDTPQIVSEQAQASHDTIGEITVADADDAGRIAQAFAQQRSDVQVQGSGKVQRTLPDDTQGSRHQRFILKLANGQTVLVAHNIDLAPRIPRLQRGDTVGFFGEYEYTAQGGVIHWTHRDPDGRHVSGWLEHNGQRYQ